MINKLGIIIKKVVFAFGIIYGVNIVLQKIGLYIPINPYTLGITSLLGIPGLLSLYVLFHFIC